MAHAYWVVVDDPQGDWLEGSVVDVPRAHQLRSRGACLLPVDGELLRACGVGGYMRRGWGAGYPVDSPSPRMHCPLTAYSFSSREAVYWAARLVVDAPALEEVQRSLEATGGASTGIVGQLRLASDPSQRVSNVAGLSELQDVPSLAKIGRPDARGGWTVGGVSKVRLPTDGVYGFGLFGWGPGLRVAWAAVSIVPKAEG